MKAPALEAMGPRLRGVILSGGPASVYEADAPHVHPDIWAYVKETGLPVLGICYGFQEMSHALGGAVERAPEREFGHAEVTAVGAGSPLLAGLPPAFKVWMSHGDKITALPPGFAPVGSTPNCEFAACAGTLGAAPMFGVQFHPEVSHTPDGKDLLGNFLVGVCGMKQDWSMASFLDGACVGRRRARRAGGPGCARTPLRPVPPAPGSVSRHRASSNA